MNTDLENARENYERRYGMIYKNPCLKCGNYDTTCTLDGNGICLIGEENCDYEYNDNSDK